MKYASWGERGRPHSRKAELAVEVRRYSRPVDLAYTSPLNGDRDEMLTPRLEGDQQQRALSARRQSSSQTGALSGKRFSIIRFADGRGEFAGAWGE